jgi:NTE family protein
MAALVGRIFVAGKIDEFESWVHAILTSNVISLLDTAWNKNGLVKGDRVFNALVGLV